MQHSWPLWSVSLLIPFDPPNCTWCLHETMSGLAALPLYYPSLSSAFLFDPSAHHKQILSSSLFLFCRVLWPWFPLLSLLWQHWIISQQGHSVSPLVQTEIFVVLHQRLFLNEPSAQFSSSPLLQLVIWDMSCSAASIELIPPPRDFQRNILCFFSKMSCTLRRCSPWVSKGPWEISPSDVSALSWGLQKYLLKVCRWCAEVIDCTVDYFLLFFTFFFIFTNMYSSIFWDSSCVLRICELKSPQ